MTPALDTLLSAFRPLVDADPEWGLKLALAWRTLEGDRPPPDLLVPWGDLLSLAHEHPSAELLADAVETITSSLTDTRAPGLLRMRMGHWLSPAWALALDEFRGIDAWPDPRFVDLAVNYPERAAKRALEIVGREQASSRAAGLLYEAFVAWQDARQAPPEGASRTLESFEEADESLVDQSERWVGRLRLASRTESDAGLTLAEEAVDWLGVDDVYAGVWAVLARTADLDQAMARLRDAIPPRTPHPEVLLDLKTRCIPDDHEEIDRAITQLLTQYEAEEIGGRQAWVGSWRLLAAAVRCSAPQLVLQLMAAPLPPWAVELATFRELRAQRRCLDAVDALLQRRQQEELPDWSPPSPPWADLDPPVQRARLSVLSDPRIPLPSGYPWGDAVP